MNENIETKFRKVLDTKGRLKTSIFNKGANITDNTPFEDYPLFVDSIVKGIIPIGSLSIIKNGTYDVTNYAGVVVEVPIPTISLQEKTITPTKEAQEVVNDNNYDGLSKVTVNPIPEEYIVPKLTTLYIRPKSENVVYVATSEGYDGYDVVSVLPPTTQTFTITPTKEIQYVEPTSDNTWIKKVTVNPIPEDYIVPSGTLDVTENGSHNIREYENVNVNVNTNTTTKSITPTLEAQTFTPPSGYIGFSQITVSPPNLEYKEVTPTKETQTFKPTGSYIGYSDFVVNSIPNEYIIPSGTLDVTTNGTHDVTNYSSVNVNVPIPEGTLEITENGEKDVTNYAKVNVNVTPNLQEKTVTPTDNKQNIVCDSGYDGLSKVTVNPIEGYVKNSKYYNLLNRTITDFVMPYDLQRISPFAFSGCGNLIYFTFTTNIDAIGNNAFEHCSSLTNITLPETVSQIGYNAFAECSRLESINIQDTIISKISEKTFYNCQALNNITIPETVSQIEANAFELCTSLSNISIPNSVTSIGQAAFRNCSKLEQITLPENLVEISSYLFYLCRKLSSITIGENIQRIGPQAFLSCSALTEVIIPNNVVYIGISSFKECSSLQKLTIPFVGQDKTSGYNWFGYIFGDEADERGYNIPSSLTEVVVTGGELQMRAFEKCRKIKNISISQDTKVIPQQCFYYCEALENFVIPQGVTDIGVQAFYLCKSMTSIVIPDSVTSIAGNAFARCDSLTSVTIPNSVISIGNYAFDIGSETNKATITMLPTTPPTIASSSFNKNYLNQIIVPIGCGDAYKSATNWSSFADYIVEASE